MTLQAHAALFGALAALLWAASALVPISSAIRLKGGVSSKELPKLLAGLRWQSWLNAAAALCAAVAIMLQ